jgi:hypothetical protein
MRHRFNQNRLLAGVAEVVTISAVSAKRTGIVIETDGSIRPAAGTDPRVLASRSGTYQLLPSPPGLLILQGEVPVDGKAPRVLMTGQVLTSSTVLEIINMVANNGWRGELVVLGEDSERRLSCERGALQSASSSLANERLGEVMVSLGALTMEQLAECVRNVSRQRRFGEIAMDLGFISREVLFEMLQKQLERIFQNALLVHSGHYWFTEVGEQGAATDLNLHLPIQQALMQSVQRIDEMAEYRARVPSGELCPVLTDKAGRMSMADSIRPVALMCDGAHSIVDIARNLRVDEFDVTRVISQLLQLGCVELREAEGFDLRAVEFLLDTLNESMEMIWEAADRHNAGAEVRETVQSWMHETRLRDFFGTTLDVRGAVPVQESIVRLEKLALERPVEALQQALHELVSFALFSASTTLPRPVTSTLTKRVSRRLSKLTEELANVRG